MSDYEFDEPPAVTLLDGETKLTMAVFVLEVVLALPFWRSSSEALELAEEVLDQVEAVKCGASKRWHVSKSALDALREQFKQGQITQNPNLVRAAIRYGRHLHRGAEKVELKKEAPADV